MYATSRDPSPTTAVAASPCGGAVASSRMRRAARRGGRRHTHARALGFVQSTHAERRKTNRIVLRPSHLAHARADPRRTQGIPARENLAPHLSRDLHA